MTLSGMSQEDSIQLLKRKSTPRVDLRGCVDHDRLLDQIFSAHAVAGAIYSKIF